MLPISSFTRLSETIDGYKVGLGRGDKPDGVNVTMKEFLDFTTGVDVVHLGIQNYLKHHFGIIRRTLSFPIESLHSCKVEILNYVALDSHRIIIRNIFNSLRKKDGFIPICKEYNATFPLLYFS